MTAPTPLRVAPPEDPGPPTGSAGAAPPDSRAVPTREATGGKAPGSGWGPAQAVGLGVSLLAGMLVGFLLFLLVGSGIAERRAQDTLYATFRGELSKATAPVGPTASGRAVALLEIPRLHLRDVVVEGTTSGDLARGPGHRRDTGLPGQQGVSVVFGRRATYGAPFRSVLSLVPGDTITTTTGLGVAHYKVTALRDASAPFRVVPGEVTDQLILETSDAPLSPSRSVLVVSTLVGRPQPAPTALPAISDAEHALHGDGAAALTLAWWAQALLLSVIVTTVAVFRWSRAAAYLVATPLIFAVLWNVFESVGRLLPNTL
jgi:sortase A